MCSGTWCRKIIEMFWYVYCSRVFSDMSTSMFCHFILPLHWRQTLYLHYIYFITLGTSNFADCMWHQSPFSTTLTGYQIDLKYRSVKYCLKKKKLGPRNQAMETICVHKMYYNHLFELISWTCLQRASYIVHIWSLYDKNNSDILPF